MPDPTIRLATAADAAAISALIESLADFFLADPADRSEAGPFFAGITPASIADAIDSGGVRYHLADDAAGVVGAVGVRDGSHLLHLFVAERAHRRGLGHRLWAVARADAQARGNPGRWTVNSSRFALPLYRRLGFRDAGEEQRMDGIAWVPMEMG